MTNKKDINSKTPVEIEALRLFEERDQIGRTTYNQGLDYNDPKYNWIDMALEELVDLLKYLIALKLRTFANMVRSNKHRISSMNDEQLINLRDQINTILKDHSKDHQNNLGTDAQTQQH